MMGFPCMKLKKIRCVFFKLTSLTLCLTIVLFLYNNGNLTVRRGLSYNFAMISRERAATMDTYHTETLQCVMPKLGVNDSIMMKFYKKMDAVTCKGEKNWVFAENGTLRFAENLTEIHGEVKCDFIPFFRGENDYKVTYGEKVVGIKDGFPLVSDFFKVSCNSSKDNASYTNLHAGVFVNQTIKDRLKLTKPPANGLGLSVALLGFDSMSRMSWLRRMPKTREYLVNTLKAIELEGYNILGDGTPAALLPILTGKHEHELPEARRGFNGSHPVDSFPWLWKDFQKRGYVTSWADAEIVIAPFNYRLLGFKYQPTDYFMRTFFLAVDPTYKKYSRFCHGSEPKHMVWLNWVRDIFYMYKDDPKFMVHFYTPLSHDDNNLITMTVSDEASIFMCLVQTVSDEASIFMCLVQTVSDEASIFMCLVQTVSDEASIFMCSGLVCLHR
ncbi:uncharacterized protein LOC131951605 [Physella acuta]|uniref:uncharacterized protein LOC131951605 n=1 Tax=Physella acuta TaxID=109671 RepID=UPI0027DC04A1|nr:uncharacterized protein LOC131951605 [Physella acuta]